MTRIVCLWLARWSLERLASARPELRERDVLLYAPTSGGGLQVVAACERLAIPIGTPLAEALATCRALAPSPLVGEGWGEGEELQNRHAVLSESEGPNGSLVDHAVPSNNRIPTHSQPLTPGPSPARGERRKTARSASKLTDLVVLPHDPLADRLALEELAEQLQTFSPTVGLEEADEPSSLLLDASGVTEQFGGEFALATRLLSWLAERGLTAHVAVADTIGAAWAMAHHTAQTQNEVAPTPPAILPAGQTREALAPLHPAALRLPEETLAWLLELGLVCIGQVATLPRTALISRFGDALLGRLDQALGTLPEVIAARTAPEEFTAQWLLEYPTDRWELLEYLLGQLLMRLTDSLEKQRLGVTQLTCRAEMELGPPCSFSVGLYQPCASAVHLRELLRLAWERRPPEGAVAALRITAVAISPLRFAQLPLFDDTSHATSPRDVAGLVDRLASRLGREAILRPWPLADAQPEHACQYLPVHFAERRPAQPLARTKPKGRAQSTSRTAAQPFAAAKSLRPVLLYPRPVPLEVLGLAPAGSPARFSWRGRDCQVSHCWGPERIETGWWRRGAVRRDYYRVETPAGERYWIFRELASRRWFLQGEFS